MPRISDATRNRRRAHILTSAWGCFALNGFQATSMDDVISATGMSSSAVYRYFRSKDEIIDATVEEGLARVRDFFVRLLAESPTPSPARALAFIDMRFAELAARPRQDMTRIAMQTWAEAIRRPSLEQRTRTLYNQVLDDVTELATHWLADGHLPPEADPVRTASTFFTLMQGMIVCNHLVNGVSSEDLLHGVWALGSGLPDTAPGPQREPGERPGQRRAGASPTPSRGPDDDEQAIAAASASRGRHSGTASATRDVGQPPLGPSSRAGQEQASARA